MTLWDTEPPEMLWSLFSVGCLLHEGMQPALKNNLFSQWVPLEIN